MSAAAYKISKRKNGRFEVRLKGGKSINGEAKTKILVDAGLVKQKIAKPKPVEAAAEETPAEGAE